MFLRPLGSVNGSPKGPQTYLCGQRPDIFIIFLVDYEKYVLGWHFCVTRAKKYVMGWQPPRALPKPQSASGCHERWVCVCIALLVQDSRATQTAREQLRGLQPPSINALNTTNNISVLFTSKTTRNQRITLRFAVTMF